MYLYDAAVRTLNDHDCSKLVSDYTLPDGNWNEEQLIQLLPEELCREIRNTHLSGNEHIEDTVVWTH